MKKQRRGKIGRRVSIALLLALLLQGVFGQLVYADTGETIVIQLSDLGTNRARVGFTICKVAVWDEDEGSWCLETSLQGENVSLETLESAEQWAQAAKAIAGSKGLELLASTSLETDAKGCVQFSNLERGMYLILPENTKAYGVITSCLVVVPSVENGTEQHTLYVEPKAAMPPEEKPAPTLCPAQSPTLEPNPSKEPITQSRTGDEAAIGWYLSLAVLGVMGMAGSQMGKKGLKNHG